MARNCLDFATLLRRFKDPGTTVEEAVGLVRSVVDIAKEKEVEELDFTIYIPKEEGLREFPPRRKTGVLKFLLSVGDADSGEPEQVREMALRMVIRNMTYLDCFSYEVPIARFLARNWDGFLKNSEDARVVRELAVKWWRQQIDCMWRTDYFRGYFPRQDEYAARLKDVMSLLVAAGAWEKLALSGALNALPMMYRRLRVVIPAEICAKISACTNTALADNLLWSGWDALPPLRLRWWVILGVETASFAEDNAKLVDILNRDKEVFERDLDAINRLFWALNYHHLQTQRMILDTYGAFAVLLQHFQFLRKATLSL